MNEPSIEWVIEQLHIMEGLQSRVEGEQNSMAVALRRAVELLEMIREVEI